MATVRSELFKHVDEKWLLDRKVKGLKGLANYSTRSVNYSQVSLLKDETSL